MEQPRCRLDEACQEPIRDRHFTSSLFRKLASASPEGWQQLTDAVTGYVRHCAGKAGIPTQDWEDLAQEVCARVASHVRSFRGARSGDHLYRWVRAIVRNQVADYFRARARRREGEPVGGPEPALAQVADARDGDGKVIAEADERRIALDTAVKIVRGIVGARTWEAFCAVALQCRDAAEVATQLGMTSHAVHQAVYRVRRQLTYYIRTGFTFGFQVDVDASGSPNWSGDVVQTAGQGGNILWKVDHLFDGQAYGPAFFDVVQQLQFWSDDGGWVTYATPEHPRYFTGPPTFEAQVGWFCTTGGWGGLQGPYSRLGN